MRNDCGGTTRSRGTSVSRRLVLYDAWRRTSWGVFRVSLANTGGHKISGMRGSATLDSVRCYFNPASCILKSVPRGRHEGEVGGDRRLWRMALIDLQHDDGGLVEEIDPGADGEDLTVCM